VGLASITLFLYTIEWIRKAIYRVSIKYWNGDKPSTLDVQEVNQ